MTTTTATPKYRTTAAACSCPGFWWRRTCRHWVAYLEARELVEQQDKYNEEMTHGKSRY